MSCDAVAVTAPRDHRSAYKTKPCWPFARGCCEKGSRCPFLHGFDDPLRPQIVVPVPEMTRVSSPWSEDGVCDFWVDGDNSCSLNSGGYVRPPLPAHPPPEMAALWRAEEFSCIPTVAREAAFTVTGVDPALAAEEDRERHAQDLSSLCGDPSVCADVLQLRDLTGLCDRTV